MERRRKISLYTGSHLGFIYRNELYNHNNRRHAPIFLDRTWVKKLWPDRNVAWYIDVLEVNTALVLSHFQNDRVVKSGMDFQRAF